MLLLPENGCEAYPKHVGIVSPMWISVFRCAVRW